MHSAYTARHVMDLALYAVICSRVDVVSTAAQFLQHAVVVSSHPRTNAGVYPRNTTSYSIPLLVVYTTAVPPSFALLAITYLVYLILVIPRIVRLPALLRVLRTLNSAPSRTIQARNHIVRAPAIVRVLWFGTYPHYRGHPTVLRTSKYLQALFLSHFCSSLRRVFWWRFSKKARANKTMQRPAGSFLKAAW